ncbi:MAG: DnaJ C-terminal domain-containing protein [Hyphococcus sp.]
MARNPYIVLGLAPTASDSEIRAAFRKLAKQYHPDRNPDDKKAEDRFKEVSAAFDIVGDPDRRKKFDRGEIDEEGRERVNPFGQWSNRAGPQGAGYGAGARGAAGGPGAGASFEDLSDIFSDLFGARRQNAQAMRGRDVRYRLEVDFLDAATGAKKRVTMPDGKTLDIAVPAGLEDGQTLRLRGQGERGQGGHRGDVYVEVKVKPHPVFERKGADIHVEAPISLKEAVLGGKITVPTIAGDVSLTVPKNTSSGTVLRLRGRGVAKGKNGAAGDQFVKLKIVLPEGGDKELEEFVKNWKGADESARKHFAGV